MQCDPGGCPDGQVCYHVADPFDKESYCLPAGICGPMSAGELAVWEATSRAKAEELIGQWQAKKQKRQQTRPMPTVEAERLTD